MNVLITLTTAGADTGPFNLYSNTDSYVTAFATSIAKSVLVAGYTSTVVPTGTSTIRVKSTGTCTNFVDLAVAGATPTTTTTTTPTPTTTTTTTAGGGTTTTTTTAGGGTTTTTTTSGGGTTTTTTTGGTPTTTTTTTAPSNQWYQLTNCDTLAVDYSAQYTVGFASINSRVTDFLSRVWTVTNTYSSSPGGSGLDIFNTGLTGCPAGTTTTTTTLAPSAQTNILVNAVTVPGSDLDCLGTPYNRTITTVTATLYDQYGNPMNAPSTITVTVNATYNPCYGGSIPTTENITITAGSSSGSTNWDASRTVDCGGEGCLGESQTYDCAFSNTASLPWRSGTTSC